MNITEALLNLKQPIPSSLISQKRVGNSTIDYIAWFDYCDLLDERLELWSWEVVNLTTSGDRLFLTGKLTIIGDERELSHMATGTESLNCSSYGDPSSNAEAMALRRCCAKFGLARDLWQKEKPSKSNRQNFDRSHRSQAIPQNQRQGKREITREEWLQLQANRR